jgi:indole-3-glycerol phosphate synthase
MDILQKIIDYKQQEVAEKKRKTRIPELEQSPYFQTTCISLKAHIAQKDFGIIAEFKRKSPTNGLLSKKSPIDVATNYAQAGVAGMSVLTDFNFFGGTNEDLTHIRKKVKIPLLRKDFIIDEYQLFEAKAIGADCVLLIAEALEKNQLHEFTIIAKSLGLEVLMELHQLEELEKFNAEVDILGVNNRDLKQQKTALSTSLKLYNYLPKSVMKISESGIHSAADISVLAEKGYQGALIGTSLLKSTNSTDKITQLISGLNKVNA